MDLNRLKLTKTVPCFRGSLEATRNTTNRFRMNTYGNKPNLQLYFATAALANIPFWIYTGVIGFLGLEGALYVLWMFVVVLLGGIASGQFVGERGKGTPLVVGSKAAVSASIVNVFFGVGTFSIDPAHVLVLVLVGFFVGCPMGCILYAWKQAKGKNRGP